MMFIKLLLNILIWFGLNQMNIPSHMAQFMIYAMQVITFDMSKDIKHKKANLLMWPYIKRRQQKLAV